MDQEDEPNTRSENLIVEKPNVDRPRDELSSSELRFNLGTG